MRFGGLEILLIFGIVLLFFGPKQIPKLTKTIKESVKNFKDDEETEENEINMDETKKDEEEISNNKEQNA